MGKTFVTTTPIKIRGAKKEDNGNPVKTAEELFSEFFTEAETLPGLTEDLLSALKAVAAKHTGGSK
jgi:hypothetical protein